MGACKLIVENLHFSGLGQMASDLVFEKYFHSVAKAKAFAERDYGKPIEWGKDYSVELGKISYTIRTIKYEV